MSVDLVESLSDLTEYIENFAGVLGEKVRNELRPLFDPDTQDLPDLSWAVRDAIPAQANVIVAAAEALRDEKSVIICGEMGTGKTYMGAVLVHLFHVLRGIDRYRVLIVCPNHLIDKWQREILRTVPGARVLQFERTQKVGKSGKVLKSKGADDSYKAVLQYINECRPKSGGRWLKPEGPEFVIVGRDQAKWETDFLAVGEHERRGWLARRTVPAGRDHVLDARGNPVYEPDPQRPWKMIAKMKTVTKVVTVCPRCGQPPRGPNGVVLSDNQLQKKQHYCSTRYLQEIGTADRPDRGKDSSGLDRIMPAPKAYQEDEVGRIVEHEGRTYEVRACGEPLFQARVKPRKDSTKWSIAKILQRKGRKLFHFMILDEMHEHKGENSAQARASAKAMSAARKIIGLTGTLIGGYANHLYPLLWRMSPRTLVDEGFDYHRDKPFVQQYGRIDTIYKTKYGDDLGRWRGRNRGTNSIRGDGKTTADIKYKPGVMPHFFGNHLISKGLFLSLSEMADGLPPLLDDDRSLVAVPMDDQLAAAYKETQGVLHAALVELLQAGSMKLLGAFMRTCLDYPDKPFGWEPPYEGTKAIGYWDDSKNKTKDTYTSVCQPPDLGDAPRNKEKALVELVTREHAEGRQCWIYLVMTKKRDIQPRLAKLLEERGLTVKILRDSTVDVRDREKWIRANAPGTDVIISHPQLVSTGLDFFDEAMTYNFATIIFYQMDYQVNLIRQAGHRHWRIGQEEECRTYYLYYVR